MNLFDLVEEEDKLHPIFKLMLEDKYRPERAVLLNWCAGFEDRDGKFIKEFQTTFESSMWELYLNAMLNALGARTDFTHHAPDFVTTLDRAICIEATIAKPEIGGCPPIAHTHKDIPGNLAEFNRQSILRLCNSISSKIKKYREKYSKFDHVANKPYVIALASFDRPFSYLSSNRGIVAALYGVYFDEETTIEEGLDEVFQISIDAVVKNENTNIPVGYFADDQHSDVSAVIYSSLATWGKIRALADNKEDKSIYTTYHPNEGNLNSEIRHTHKADYVEDLLDGVYVLHNPFAIHPLKAETFNHERVAQMFVTSEGELEIIAPDDFLLMRHLNTVNVKEWIV